jgi:hypothetical protein
MVGFRFDLSAPHIVVPVRITGAQRVRWLNLILDTCQQLPCAKIAVGDER